VNRRRILSLTVVQLLVGAALVAAAAGGGAQFGSTWRLALLAAAFALVGLLPMHLELGRSACTITLGEAVLIVALFTVGPLGVALAASVGEVVACLVLRLSPMKVAYSAGAWAAATLAAALAFGGLSGAHPHADSPRAWLAALGAIAAFAAYNFTATTLAQSVVEGRRVLEVARTSAALAALSALMSGSVGLITLALVGIHPAAPLLLVPLVAIALLETRRAAGYQAEHLRFERLYAASGRTTGLDSLEQALARSASEARSLVTGVAAACCVSDRDGNWSGMLVDDEGARPASDAMIASVVRLVGAQAPGECSASGLGAAQRQALPSCTTIVVAGDTGGSEPIALAVFRELASDNQGDARAEVLAAFVGHAGLTAANATLFQEVQDALAHQVDLNRQKDEFSAAVSHELRTPLAAMLTSISTLRRLEGRMDEKSRGRVLEMADRQGKRLHRLIDDLLMLAAIEQSSAHLDAEAVDVAALVTEVNDELRRLADNVITADIGDDVGTIASSPARLRQVLTNLVENAVKYGAGSAIEVVGRRHADDIVLAVIDHGNGIAVKETSRVFERFVQLDQSATRTHGGTGLGLHLCRKIAELLDGTLVLSPTPGGGATFTLTFPATPSHSDQPSGRGYQAPAPLAPWPPSSGRAIAATTADDAINPIGSDPIDTDTIDTDAIDAEEPALAGSVQKGSLP
jgi:signal transduction histidine kinase